MACVEPATLLWQQRCTSKRHDCVKAAVINAAFAFGGLVAAEALERLVARESRIFHNFRARISSAGRMNR